MISLSGKAKRTIKAGLVASGLLRAPAWFLGPAVAILRYHSVQEDPERHVHTIGTAIIHSLDSFRRQIEIIARDYHPVSLDDVLIALQEGRALPRRTVAITFDDGYLDNWELAAPVLQQYGVPASFYVVVGAIDTGAPPWFCRLRHAIAATQRTQWADSVDGSLHSLCGPERRREAFLIASRRCAQLSGIQQMTALRKIEQELGVEPLRFSDCPMLSWDQVRALRRAGHAVGSHTVSHPNAAFVSTAEFETELIESKRRLEEELEVTVAHFSYPSPVLQPHFSEQSIEQTRRAGFRTAVTCESGVVRAGDEPLRLRRVFASLEIAEFRWVLENSFLGRSV